MATTRAQQLFVLLDQERKEFLQRFDETLAEVANEVGINGFFQADDGVVYKIVEPAGKYVKFEKISFLRTKRGDEKAGTLSVKEAKEVGGFEV